MKLIKILHSCKLFQLSVLPNSEMNRVALIPESDYLIGNAKAEKNILSSFSEVTSYINSNTIVVGHSPETKVGFLVHLNFLHPNLSYVLRDLNDLYNAKKDTVEYNVNIVHVHESYHLCEKVRKQLLDSTYSKLKFNLQKTYTVSTVCLDLEDGSLYELDYSVLPKDMLEQISKITRSNYNKNITDRMCMIPSDLF